MHPRSSASLKNLAHFIRTGGRFPQTNRETHGPPFERNTAAYGRMSCSPGSLKATVLAMQVLYGRHSCQGVSLGLRLVRTNRSQEDSSATVFLACVRHAGKLKADLPFSTWLLAITRSKALLRCGAGRTLNWTTRRPTDRGTVPTSEVPPEKDTIERCANA